MRNIILLLGLTIIIVTILVFLKPAPKNSSPTQTSQPASTDTISDNPKFTVYAKNLDTPWAIAFLPDKSLLITERAGRVRLINEGKLQEEPVATLSQVREIGEGGLLGIALSPDFSANQQVFLYYTYQVNGQNTLNRVVKMTLQNNKLSDEKIIVDQIPGAQNHNGGRIKFGPDKYLYITTGDAQNPSLSQDKNSLAGKILRVTEDGKGPSGNPFNNLVYSYGHRNPQGIVWGSDGKLWETEHGPSGGSLGFGNDEINIIFPGKNYGWPIIQGDEIKEGMEKPLFHSGSTTWAPADLAYLNGTLFFGGLKGQTLYKAKPSENGVSDFVDYFKGQFGRIREVILGPDNMLYITTSNKDGRGVPDNSDDKIIKINPQKL